MLPIIHKGQPDLKIYVRISNTPLAVTTFVAGNAPLTRLMKRRKTMHAFHISDLQQYLAEAGFEGFEPRLDGTFLMFSARKAMLFK